MIKFWWTVFRSSKFMNRLANEIGVDRSIYKTALTEVGVNFALYEGMYQQSADSKQATLRNLALLSCEPAVAGAAVLQAKFPEQDGIREFVRQILRYAQSGSETLQS